MFDVPRRGFALIWTLAAVVIALMLLGAFLASHRGHLNLSRMDDDRRACLDAMLALSDYCLYRLEKERDWGKNPAAATRVEDSLGRQVLEFQEIGSGDLADFPELEELGGQTHVVGHMEGSGVGFHIAITNNFDGLTLLDGVPRKGCRIRIETVRGSARERREVAYRSAAFVDATVAASKNIKILVGEGPNERLILESKDPIHNELRSLQNVILPGADDIRFRPDQQNLAAVRGTVWAHDNISVDGDSTIDEDDTQAALDSAAAQTRGDFIANGRTHYEVPDLTLEQARAGSDHLPRMDLRCGTYYFNKVEVTFDKVGGGTGSRTIPVFQRFEPRVDNSQGDLTDFDFVKSDLPDDAVVGSVRIAGQPSTALAHGHDNDDFRVDDGPKISFYEGGDFRPTAILPTGKNLVVKPETVGSRTVPGDLKIKGHDDIVPTVLFQKEDGSSEEGEGRVCLNVARDLVVEGKIVGGGKLIAGEDVALQANRVDVSTNEQSDLAVYAGGDVRIYPGANRETLADDDGEPGEGEVVREVVDGKFLFKGLIYAHNDFSFASKYRKITASGEVEWYYYNVDLEIEGAVVARNGSAKISGRRSVRLTYNPKYLDDFFNEEFSGNDLQVEELSWRPI